MSSKKTVIRTVYWNNENSFKKFKELRKLIGKPNQICNHYNSNRVSYVVWQVPLDNHRLDKGKFNGLDYIKISNYNANKFHPEPASVFVISGKYIQVPKKLFGPIKYASETINIEQLFVPKKFNQEYDEDSICLVTGSCASVTIGALTVKLVEDLIKKYKHTRLPLTRLNSIFRNEYDKLISNYLCGKPSKINFGWINPKKFNESKFFDGGKKFNSCNKLEFY